MSLSGNILILVGCAIAVAFVSCIPAKYTGPKESVAMYKDLDRYVTDMIKALPGLRLHAIGNPTDARNVVYGFMLHGSDTVTLEEGRKLATALNQQFWHHIQNSSYVEADRVDTQKNSPWRVKPLTLQQVGIRIDYWDKDVNRPKHPYLAQILFVDSKFHYFEADPQTQELKLVFEESYQDAIKFQNEDKHISIDSTNGSRKNQGITLQSN